MDIFATNTTATLSDGAAVTNAHLRVASLSIAAYEYVSGSVSLLIVTHIRPAISLPSLWNIGCIGPSIEAGKKTGASSWRYTSLDLDTLHTRLRLLELFILIRHVCSTLSFVTCSHRFYRYCSIIVMVLSNVGFFYHHFSPNICHRYYHVTPVFKR
jgi:hypothetical protein